MAKAQTYKVGQAPWETKDASQGPQTFKVGEAPWEKTSAAAEKTWLDTELPGGTARGYIKGALNSLPIAGTIAGGVAGGASGTLVAPVAGTAGGAVVGAGLGGGIGTSLKNMGEQYILGEHKQPGQVLKDVALSIPESAAAEVGGQLIGKGLQFAAKTPLGQAVARKAGDGAARIGELFTGVPRQEIETYAKHADAIKAMSKNADGSVQEAADQVRRKFMSDIQAKRQALNAQIGQTLESRAGQTVDSTPIVEALKKQQAQINSKLYPDQIYHIDDVIKKVESLAKDGKLSLSDAHEVKSFLQDIASPSYKPGVFPAGKDVQRAAKSAAAIARTAVEKEAPEIAAANAELSRLHQVSKNANKNLFTADRPASALMSAGSGANAQNVKVLENLGEVTGTPMLQDAQNLAAMRTFGKPQLMPADATGKAVGRMGLASGIGYLVGGPAGAVVAGGVTSPAALKIAIDTGRALGPGTVRAATNPELLAGVIRKGMGTDSAPVDSSETDRAPELRPTEKPLKGKDKWANDGIKKLEAHASDADIGDVKSAIANPKVKQLLVIASDLKPGSKAMDRVWAQIQDQLAKGDR